jgi:hypothetical protein
MSIEDTKKELAASGWKTKPEDNLPVTKEELMARIKETARAMDTNFKNRVDHAGTTRLHMVRNKNYTIILMLGNLNNFRSIVQSLVLSWCHEIHLLQ